MIIDCLMFFNEHDMLESRLEYLYDSVDKFVIVESDTTFSGQSKPYNFEQEQDRYKKFLNKIVYLKFSPDITGLDFSVKPDKLDFSAAHWQVEFAQRQHLLEGLKNCHGDNVVLINDVDEIPNKNLLPHLVSITQSKPAVALEQRMFYYNLKNQQVNPWCGTVAATARQVKLRGVQWCRDYRSALPRLDQGGWHLSYFGTPEQIQLKIKNFSHQELNDEKYTDLVAIQQRIDQGQDLFNREGNTFKEFDPQTLPNDFLKAFGRFV